MIDSQPHWLSSSSCTTWVVDHPCPRTDISTGEPERELSCEIVRVEDSGVPTPHLWCAPHGHIVGHVTDSDGGRARGVSG